MKNGDRERKRDGEIEAQTGVVTERERVGERERKKHRQEWRRERGRQGGREKDRKTGRSGGERERY